jgi:tripartite-type tricarboxylate transporter receptor subunit TctC
MCRLRAFCFFAALLGAPGAWAQTEAGYPAKPIRLVVGFTAGGISDLLARSLGARLTANLRQQVVVDNRPGAGTIIASALVAKSPPDGYTLFMQDITTHAINATLYQKLPYDSVRDFTPVSLVAATPVVVLVHPSLPVKTVKELIALAKSAPASITYASAGNGTILHLAGEMLSSTAGIKLLHVPYKGGADAVQAVIRGEAAMAFTALSTALPQVKAGRLRAIAVTTPKRVEVIPAVATVAEAGFPTLELVLYSGVLAPPGLSKEIVARLNAELATAVRSAEMKPIYESIGAQPLTSTPEEFMRFLSSEIARLGKVVQQARVRIE